MIKRVIRKTVGKAVKPMSSNTKIVPVILSGGKGTRLWPMSRAAMPKQFLPLNSEEMGLIEETALRVSDRSIFEAPIVICSADHRFLVKNKMERLGIKDFTAILEPSAHDTAAAIAAVAAHIQSTYNDALMLVLPADHIIKTPEKLVEAVTYAAQIVAKGSMVSFGIKPTAPETGFGYIKYGEKINGHAYVIDRFVEKPNQEKAEEYVASGDYAWNSGIFLFSTKDYLSELENFEPEIKALSVKAYEMHTMDNGAYLLNEDVFSSIKGKSIDYAIMEHTKKSAVVPMDCGWDDAGSWDALWTMKNKDENGNVLIGTSYNIDTHNTYIMCPRGPRVATIGLNNMVIVSTKDCVMIAPRNRAQDVKAMVDLVKQSNEDLIEKHREEYRPWGMYDKIDGGYRFQTRRISVDPGAKMSLQQHLHRSEHLIVVKGIARITIEGTEQLVSENQSVYIPNGAIHRIENPGKINLEMIEVQTGSYLNEDDIIRYEDSYGRKIHKQGYDLDVIEKV